MTIADAILQCLASQHDRSDKPQACLLSLDQSLDLLVRYFSRDARLGEITPAALHDFIARWYVEEASASMIGERDSTQAPPVRTDRPASNAGESPGQVPAPLDLLDSLSAFFQCSDRENGTDQTARLSPILSELRSSLPRALELAHSLTSSLKKRGGAFNFPEFLTSFEEGGSSQYDIDVPGHVGAIDGYFRIVSVEDSSVEAEELISEERLGPIHFPAEIAGLLSVGYIINLEIVRAARGWEIAACGFVYPPGTKI